MASTEKLVRLHKSLMQLSRGTGFIDYPRISKLKRISRACAEQLDVSRVSVWRLSKDNEVIVCEVLYILEADHYFKGAELRRSDFPEYFNAMEEDRIINADNAITDPRTCEFTEPYLIPNDISSMLDAPIYAAGKLQGVVCLEQVGEARVWDLAELSYVASLADSISMVNEHENWLKDRQQLEFLEQYDSLTGLETRNNFQKRLEFDLQGELDPDRTRVLVLLGLDFFASINDNYGHKTADSLLVALARLLEFVTQPYHCRLARVGGDLFGIWLPDLKNTEQLDLLNNKLKTITDNPIKTEDDTLVSVSFSSGIVIYPTESSGQANPMRCAEIALQRAKSESRGSEQYFSLEWLEQLKQKRSLENELIAALDNSELVAHYQPILSTKNEKVIGLEALVRWRHPTRGLIPPGQFLPLAKKLGLMERLGSFMLKQAAGDIKRLHDQGSTIAWVSVNISSEQLYNSQLSQQIADILHEHDLPPESLELEIVEELISQDSALVRAQLTALSELGIRLAIDDFGTGYSSLSRLKHMPVTKLKVDKSFVDGLPHSEDDCCITQSIIGLAKGLEIELVAEGVEYKEQAEYLMEAECEYVQGFYYAKPMPLNDLLVRDKKLEAV